MKEPKRVYFGNPPIAPMFQHGICAGFPSPADDYLDENIDLEKILTPNLPATFYWRVNGHSMENLFHDKDLLIVDRSLKARHNCVVVAVVNGELTLKRLLYRDGRPVLVCDNKDFSHYKYPENAEIEIWGVVTYSITSHVEFV